MPAPVIGLFAECPSETVFSLAVVLAAELARLGQRVLLVDADPAHAPYAGLPEAPIPAGVSFLGLLGHPDAEPLVMDCSLALLSPRARDPGRVWMVPALAQGEVGSEELLRNPPLQGSRRYLALRHTLDHARPAGQPEPDITLLVGPVGSTALGCALLAHGCHAALLLADNTPKQVLWLASMARSADARRGGLLPTTCVEARDNGEAMPDGAWTDLWRTQPSYLPPHRRGQTGPERLVILEDGDAGTTQLAQAALDLARLARDEGTVPSPVAFATLYAEDRGQALALFNTEIRPRLGTRDSAIESLRAVWQAEPRVWEDVQHLARYTVQKLRWEEPTAAAEELLPVYEALAEQAEADALAEGHARALIDLAGLLTHVGAWRLDQGQPVEGLAARVEALLRRAKALERTPADCARTAEVLGLHARLSGSAVHYDWMLMEMRVAQEVASRTLVLQTLVDIVSDFARVSLSLWGRVLALCDELMPLDPRYAHYQAILAYTHLSQPWAALEHLGRLYTLDIDAFFAAFADPDLKPLWEQGGSRHLPPPPLRPTTR